MLNGLSLFSGYAGIDLALAEYVRPILYCEIEKYPQGILISRMDDESIPFAPAWNDVTTLDGTKLRGLVDIVYGGFPCQDISVAGKGAGLEGKRSGLFYEVARLVKEIKPAYIFLENVPAIRTRGAIEVQETLAELGYDSRWTHISAAEVGANHKRERWFCLAYSSSKLVRNESEQVRERSDQTFTRNDGENRKGNNLVHDSTDPFPKEIPNADSEGFCGEAVTGSEEDNKRVWEDYGWPMSSIVKRDWWSIEPDVGRVANGITFRMDRIKALGNGVVPLQVKTAFEILMGIKKENHANN